MLEMLLEISYALTGSMTRALGPKLVLELSTSNSTRRSPVEGSNTPISRVWGSAQYNFSLIQSQARSPKEENEMCYMSQSK